MLFFPLRNRNVLLKGFVAFMRKAVENVRFSSFGFSLFWGLEFETDNERRGLFRFGINLTLFFLIINFEFPLYGLVRVLAQNARLS